MQLTTGIGRTGREWAPRHVLCAMIGAVVSGEMSAEPPQLRGRTLTDQSIHAPCTIDEKTCVTLVAVAIEGSHALPAADLAETYAAHLGSPVDLQSAAAIARSVTRRYLDAGYFLSQAVAPPQDISGGVIHIRVYEGRISSVRINGPAAGQVKPYLEGLDSRPLARLADIDRQLALASDIPGVGLLSRIEPSTEDPAAHVLVVDTAFRPLQTYAQLGNRGADGAGPLQAYGQLSFNGVLMDRDQLTIGALTTPADPSQFSYLVADYSVRTTSGARASMSLAASRREDGFNPASPVAGGDALMTSFRYEHPLGRRKREGLWVGAQFDAQRFRNDWLGAGGYHDELRVVRAHIRGYRTEGGGTTNIYLSTAFGLDLLGASETHMTRRSRMADASFAKVYAHASREQSLGDTFSFYGGLDGQWSPEPLLLSEAFSGGGPGRGRAYTYGDIIGDSGLAASFELRAKLVPPDESMSFLQTYLFYDYAEVWDRKTINDDDVSLTSAGVGLRADFFKRLSARIETAKPLTRTPYDEQDRDWRHFFTLSAAY